MMFKNRVAHCKARLALLSLLFFLASTACERQAEFETVVYSGDTMGTTYHIKLVVAPDQRQTAEESQQAVDALLVDFNQSLSTYIQDSEISMINAAPVQQWLDVSPRFFAVLSLSREISEYSDGAFDVTVGPLVNLWGFGPDWKKDEVPSAEAIAETLAYVGYTAITFDTEKSRIKKQKVLELDFSAVAKGRGVDEVADYLESQGFANFMVEIGGELRLHGHNPEKERWRIGVESPAAGGSVRPIAVSEVGVATSGDYRNYFEQDGIRFSHTLDPFTGKPITHNLASVTVIAETSARADALATAFNVMGGDKAMTLANQDGIAVYLIERSDKGFVSRYSSAFSPYLMPE
jgi:thiamine biosynthesis lipoprotein